MKVALIHPPDNSGYPVLGISYIAAYLESKGHKARVFDLQIPARRQSWNQDLSDFAPDIIGITAVTLLIAKAANIATECKKILPKATLVLGGHHVTYLPNETMRQYNIFDAGVLGEGEETLFELVEAIKDGGNLDKVDGLIFRQGNGLVQTGPRARLQDLDNLPLPHTYYDFDYYLWNGTFSEGWAFKCASMIVSRGCPFQCRFCASQMFWSKKYTHCSPEKVVKEMQWLFDRGARSVFFRDSTFTLNKKWVKAFCEAKRGADVNMRWLCNSRVDVLTEDMLVEMKKAGLMTICFGVESGSQHVLDYYNKGVTVEQCRKVFSFCQKHGISTAAYFMIGAPNETREDIEKSRKLAHDLNIKQIYWYICSPLPGSKMLDDFINLGYKPDYENIAYNRASIPIGGMSPKEIEAIHHNLNNEFKRSVTRKEAWKHRIKLLSSIRSKRDMREVGNKIIHRLGVLNS